MKRVLVVDDERDIAESLADLLASAYQVSVAFDGAEALRLLRAGSVDAVVLDLMMPVMSGEALMAELQRQDIRVPVIFASAANDLPQRYEQSGAADFIAKPFKFSALKRKLAKVLGHDDGGSGPASTSGSENTNGPGSSGRNPGGGAGSLHPSAQRSRHLALDGDWFAVRSWLPELGCGQANSMRPPDPH